MIGRACCTARLARIVVIGLVIALLPVQIPSVAHAADADYWKYPLDPSPGVQGTGVQANINAILVSGSQLIVAHGGSSGGGAAAALSSAITPSGVRIRGVGSFDGTTWTDFGGNGSSVDDGKLLNTTASTCGRTVGRHYVQALAGTAADLYVGGHFDFIGGITAGSIARRQVIDGTTTWTSLGGITGICNRYDGNYYNEVTAMAVAGSDLYATGSFTNFNNDGGNSGANVTNMIAKWNGTAWSALGGGLSTTGTSPKHGRALVWDTTHSVLYVGGHFDSVSNTVGGSAIANTSAIACWNGSTWSALGAGSSDISNSVQAMVRDSSGNLFVGGIFTSIGGATSTWIAKFTPTGPCTGSWSAVGANGLDSSVIGSGATERCSTSEGVLALAVDSGSGHIFASCRATANYDTKPQVLKWNLSSWSFVTGTCVSSCGDSIAYSLTRSSALAVFGGYLYVGGSMLQHVSNSTGLARWGTYLDSTPPVAIGTPDLASGSDSGSLTTDNITNDDTPTISASVSALEVGATGYIKATKVGSSDVTCTLSSGSCTLGSLAEGTWSIVSYQADASGNLSTESSAISITVDLLAPTTATLAATAATSTVTEITFTVTGSEALDCATLATTANTDFALTSGVTALTAITQTSATVCTIAATSTAVADGVAVTSTLTAAASFSASDKAGNALTTLTASPQSVVVTIAAPAVSGGGAATTTTILTTTTTTTLPIAPKPLVTPIKTTNSPRVTVPGVVAPRKVTVLTSAPESNPSSLLAYAVRDLTLNGNRQTAEKVSAAIAASASAVSKEIAEATSRLAVVLGRQDSTKLEVMQAKAAVADAASLTILTALEVTKGNVTSLALPITQGRLLLELEHGEPRVITPNGAQKIEKRIINESTVLLTSPKDNLSLAMTAVQSDGNLSPVSSKGGVVVAPGQSLALTGSGFKPNSPVVVWMMSTPRNFGTVITDARGSFAAEVPMPDSLHPGDHTAQVNGTRPSGEIRSLNLGVEVGVEETLREPTTGVAKEHSFSSRIQFDPQSFVLTQDSLLQIAKIAEKLFGASEISVTCSGFTQLGIVRGRYSLAQNRAEIVCHELRKLGVTAKFRANGYGRSKSANAGMRHVTIVVNYKRAKVAKTA